MIVKAKLVLEAIIVLAAVVCIWRGVWGLLDLYLIPNDLTSSLVVSILIGAVIIFFLGKKIVKFL